jgi:hypothetical protein
VRGDFAGAGRTEEEDVLALGNEACGGELVDERAIHLLVEIEIKGVERALGVTETRELAPAFEQATWPSSPCGRDHDARLRRGRASERHDKAAHARIPSR